MMNSSPSHVAVIGAGIAGLVTAKVLLRSGFEITVFEKEPALGGVWAPSRTYPGLRANNSKLTYCFSDYPYPNPEPAYPEAEEIRDYLNSYADHFGLRPHIRFGREITDVSTLGADARSGFAVTSRETTGSASPETRAFSHLAICNGPFSVPSIPDLPGSEIYGGRIRHSSQCTDPEIADAERVIIVGGGKSALDCAAWAAREGKDSALVFRQAHWMFPRYMPGGVQSDLKMISRFAELFVESPTRTRFEKLLHGPGKALVGLWWGLQNRIVPRAAKMPAVMVPERPLPEGLESIGQIDDFYELLNAGRIEAKRARVTSFREKGVTLDDGTDIDGDLIIFATGWKRDLSFLDDSLRNQVRPSGRFRLYRRILPPEQPRLAFVGYFPTLACSLSSEISAHWVAQCFKGTLPLPSISEMDAEIETVEAWARKRMPDSDDGIFTGPFQAHYVDDLIRDMGLPTRRTGNLLEEYFGTFLPTRYASLETELRDASD